MEFLGIGPLELIFIVLIALVLLGPDDMLRAARSLGRIVGNLIRSPLWGDFQRSVNSLRNLPYSVAREAGIEDEIRNISGAVRMNVPEVRIAPLDIPDHVRSVEEVSAAERMRLEEPPVILDTPEEPLSGAPAEPETAPQDDLQVSGESAAEADPDESAGGEGDASAQAGGEGAA